MPDDPTERARPAAWHRRTNALAVEIHDDAVPPYEMGQLNFFPDEDEKYIRQEVERMSYEPELPNGGDKERKIIARLEKLAEDTEWAGSGRARAAIAHWQKVLPGDPRNAGRYYTRKPMTLKANKDEFLWAQMIRTASHEAREWSRKWFAQMLLDGLPEEVSDFSMEVLFLLLRPNGEVDRLVRIPGRRH